jgi:hypothetical protein
MDDLINLESSLMTKMHELFGQYLPQITPSRSAEALPIVGPTTASPLLGFTPATESTPKVGVESEGTSPPKEKNGPGDNSLVPHRIGICKTPGLKLGQRFI